MSDVVTWLLEPSSLLGRLGYGALAAVLLWAGCREAVSLVLDVRHFLRTGLPAPSKRWFSCPWCGAYHLRHPKGEQ